MKKRAAALVAACLVVSISPARAEDEPARRAAIAKLGRLVWSEKGKLHVADLDGGRARDIDFPGAPFLRVLPDGRRALSSGDGRVRVVELSSLGVKDLTSDAESDEFDAFAPPISPDGRYAVFWHGPRRPNLPADPFAYAVFDLDGGTRRDVGEIKFQDVRRPFALDVPNAWWSDDGALYACVAAPMRGSDKDGERWKIVRWSPKEGKTTDFAELPWGTWVRFADFRAGRAAYAVEPQQDFKHVPQVLDGDGKVLFERHGFVWGVSWEADGTAVRLRENSPDSPPVTTFWRVVPGEEAVEIPEFEPFARAPIDAADFVEERSPAGPRKGGKRKPFDEPEHELFRVTTATGEAVRIGPGRAPRRVGDAIVFWRVTVADKAKEGPYFEFPEVVPGKDDLWAFDPKDGAVLRLTDRGFHTRAWDVAPAIGVK